MKQKANDKLAALQEIKQRSDSRKRIVSGKEHNDQTHFHLYTAKEAEITGKNESTTPIEKRSSCMHQSYRVQSGMAKASIVRIIHMGQSHKNYTNQQMLGIQVHVPDLICATPAEGIHPKFCGIN